MTKKRERLSRLVEAVGGSGMLHLREAAALLGVSEMTVRRDVADSAGRLAALGGYVVSDKDMLGSYALDREEDHHRVAKAAACEQALALIEPEDTLFIDCGTTLPHLALRLPTTLKLTVVCYALNIAELVAKRPGIRLILLGGLYHASSASFSGDDALATLKRLRLNKAFISAGGVHASRGVSCSNFHEAPIKRAARDNALNSYLVVDASKLDTIKPVFFADCDEFAGLISERGRSSVAAALAASDE